MRLKMIKFKNKTLEEFSIDPVTAVITNSQGDVQETSIHKDGRPYFKGMHIHVIQVDTHLGYKKGYDVHHLDENKLNNSLSNLVYLTKNEHMKIHSKGHKVSEETRKKMSDAQKGKNNPLYGKHHSEETKQKLSDAQKGKSPWNKGKKLSEEHKQKLSEAHKGKQFSEEARKKISEAIKAEKNPMFGKQHSLETKQKMSEAHKNMSEETRKKMSEAKKGKIWINNNVEQRRIPFDSEIPEGFKRGMLKK